MAQLHLLGTGAGFSDAHRHTTMLSFSDENELWLVDCGGDVIQRALSAGLDISKLSGMIITHEHPDHVSGFVLFLERIWLAGRRDDVHVYGPTPALDQAKRLLNSFNFEGWAGFPDVVWHTVGLEENSPLLESESFIMTASPTDHAVPTIGMRVVNKQTGKVVAYSCDTVPSEVITRMSNGADILVHEASGAGPVHSSMEEAAVIAKNAGAYQLVLVHLPAGNPDEPSDETLATFPNTEFGDELAAFEF